LAEHIGAFGRGGVSAAPRAHFSFEASCSQAMAGFSEVKSFAGALLLPYTARYMFAIMVLAGEVLTSAMAV
jgi:hypothetical protein